MVTIAVINHQAVEGLKKRVFDIPGCPTHKLRERALLIIGGDGRVPGAKKRV